MTQADVLSKSADRLLQLVESAAAVWCTVYTRETAAE